LTHLSLTDRIRRQFSKQNKEILQMKIEKLADVLEVAIRIERQGLELYRKLHETLKDPKERDVFSFLAAAEERHLGTFRNLLEKVADYEPRYEYPGEYEAYLSGLAHSVTQTQSKIDNYLKSGKSEDACRLGIELEMQSILFYSEIREGFGEPERGIIDKVVGEEKAHYARLSSSGGKFNF
jgi:rubrerythrin